LRTIARWETLCSAVKSGENVEMGRWLLRDTVEEGDRRDVDTACKHADPGEVPLDRDGRSAYSVVALKIRLKLVHGVLGGA